jgi:hypothetical protein
MKTKTHTHITHDPSFIVHGESEGSYFTQLFNTARRGPTDGVGLASAATKNGPNRPSYCQSLVVHVHCFVQLAPESWEERERATRAPEKRSDRRTGVTNSDTPHNLAKVVYSYCAPDKVCWSMVNRILRVPPGWKKVVFAGDVTEVVDRVSF